MTKDEAIKAIKEEKKTSDVPFALIINPYPEDRAEPYIYCPVVDAAELCRHGIIEQII